MMNFAIYSLHIGLGIVLRIMNYLEADCDIIDGTKSPKVIEELEALLDEVEGTFEDDEEKRSNVIEEDNDEMLNDVMRQNKVNREQFEADWDEKSLEVL